MFGGRWLPHLTKTVGLYFNLFAYKYLLVFGLFQAFLAEQQFLVQFSPVADLNLISISL